MMMLLRRNVGGPDVLINKGKSTDDCCQRICEVLWDRSKAKDEFAKTMKMIEAALSHFKGDRRIAHRLRDFTSELLPEVKKNRPTGTVTYFNPDRGFGFIATPGQPDVFVHYTQIKGSVRNRNLAKGEMVEFDISNTEKGPQAHNVKLLSPTIASSETPTLPS
jgi:CspA family cold shock protein